MGIRTSFIGSSIAATVVPGWNDYEHKWFEKLFLNAGVCTGLAVTSPSGLNLSVAAGTALVEFTNTNLNHGQTYKVYATNDAAVSLTAVNNATSIVVMTITPANPNANADNIATLQVISGSTVPANSVLIATIVSSGGTVTTITAAPKAQMPSTFIQQLTPQVPTGSVFPFAGTTAPTDYLLCAGQAVSRTTFSTLFALIGTTYGTGDGSTTFNVPDLRGRFPLGKDDMGGTAANRVTATQADNLGQASGAESITVAGHTHNVTASQAVSSGSGRFGFVDAVTPITSSSSGGFTQNTMNPYITLNYIIRI